MVVCTGGMPSLSSVNRWNSEVKAAALIAHRLVAHMLSIFPRSTATVHTANGDVTRWSFASTCERVARPDAPPLALPERNYFLWSGSLSSAAALRHAGDIPSLIWPEDRSWFIGAPIFTAEIAVGADERTIQDVLDAPALGARRAERGGVLMPRPPTARASRG